MMYHSIWKWKTFLLFIHFSTRRKRRLIKGAIRNLALLQKEKKKDATDKKSTYTFFFFKPSMIYHTVPWKNQSIHPRPTNQQEPYKNKQVVYLTAWNKHVLH